MIVTPHLVAYYPFEGNGNDASGNGRNLSATNSPTFADGRFGRATSVVRASGQLWSLASPGFPTGTNPLTVCVWIRPSFIDVGGFMSIVTRWQNNSVGQWGLAIDGNGRPRFHATSSGAFFAAGHSQTAATTPILSADTWYHVLGDYDPATNTIGCRVNGSGRITGAFTGGIYSGHDTAFRVGARGNDSPASGLFDGIIDDVQVYDRLLTESDIRRIMLGMHPLHG